jgi:hypothetical protein
VLERDAIGGRAKEGGNQAGNPKAHKPVYFRSKRNKKQMPSVPDSTSEVKQETPHAMVFQMSLPSADDK